jgi:tripartite-type tricarboxylate transporter receptor subunit TctC
MKREVIMGGSGAGSNSVLYPAVLNNVLGTKFKVVAGYPGSKEVTLAIERNEVQGVCGYGWSSLIAQNADLLNSGKIKVIAQEAAKSHPDLDKMGVPMAVSFAKTPEQRQILDLIYGQLVFGRPYILPPDVPADRVALLRKAFDATMKDKGFLADAKKSRLDVDSVSGQEVQALVAKMYETPPAIVAKAKDALVYKGKK